MNNLWRKQTKDGTNKIFNFCDGYKDFISKNKTERECLDTTVSVAKEKGFKSIDEFIKKGSIKPGDKIYAVNRGKMAVFVRVGKDDIEKGLNIVGSHIDSPRLDLKINPLYESEGLALLDTHYYGGIKKYQWLAIPLALHGVVCKKDGTKIKINIGDKEDDPVFAISDLLPHLKSNEKIDTISGELLNVLAGSIPTNEEKEAVKRNVLNILKTQNIEEKDLISAEIEVVPAGRARDLGFDKSMILGYGQDDRVCAYTAFMGLMDQKSVPTRTSVCLLVDKEEIGSYGATGMSSRYFENIIAEIVSLLGKNELSLRRCLTNSFMLSSDVTAAYDPNYPDPMNKNTEAYLAKGISFNKYTGSKGKYNSNDSNPEFIAKLRKILDEEEITYQFTEMGKVDAGGGGTIAFIMAKYGMEVIDAGVALLNMHAPWEISCKADVYEAYKCYVKFYQMKE